VLRAKPHLGSLNLTDAYDGVRLCWAGSGFDYGGNGYRGYDAANQQQNETYH
jgi:hypothetical protein